MIYQDPFIFTKISWGDISYDINNIYFEPAYVVGILNLVINLPLVALSGGNCQGSYCMCRIAKLLQPVAEFSDHWKYVAVCVCMCVEREKEKDLLIDITKIP